MVEYLKFFLILLMFQLIFTNFVSGLFEFPKFDSNVPADVYNSLSSIIDKLDLAVQMGMDSFVQQERLEGNLINSEIVVENGSISHAQLLETYPNDISKREDKIAKQILKSTLYLVNLYCKNSNIDIKLCVNYLSQIPLPKSKLKDECLKLTKATDKEHSAFRRLLPPNYRDGAYEMLNYPKVPRPRDITHLGLYKYHDSIKNGNSEEEETKNLILVQWSQFIEHDISKLAVSTMSNGSPIECCNKDFYKLTPRYVHPSCAQLEDVKNNSFGRVPCLNYVRSSLAVDSKCNFGPAQQLNQVTSSLDLSQLYGYTEESRKQMRTFVDGKLKTSYGNLLPLAEDKEKFCVSNENNTNEFCFMAGDSRVNSNPFVTILYTIFLRKHNMIAEFLRKKHSNWNDEDLYNTARTENIKIYRNIIYNEWLPMVLGENIASNINSEPILVKDQKPYHPESVSNEFAVAAIRFYYSMMPNSLFGAKDIYLNLVAKNERDISFIGRNSNELFSLQDEYYKPSFLSNDKKLAYATEAMLNQRAMKMDANYAESLTKHYLKTESSAEKISGADALAWDIQRGRDHGLAGYIKYLEICAKTKIESWKSLEKYINQNDVEKLKSIYNSVEDIDLIVGGIFEKSAAGSILGPTFSCILGEQFSNTRKVHLYNDLKKDGILNGNGSSTIMNNQILHNSENEYNAAKLLCDTINIVSVPKNIFKITSDTKNPLVFCSDFS